MWFGGCKKEIKKYFKIIATGPTSMLTTVANT
jgi:hypothetical protein